MNSQWFEIRSKTHPDEDGIRILVIDGRIATAGCDWGKRWAEIRARCESHGIVRELGPEEV